MPVKIGSISNVPSAPSVGSGLRKALTQLARIKPPGNGKGGTVMEEVPEEEEVGGYFGKANKLGKNRGGTVMEIEPEEELIQGKTLLSKLTYQICEDDIRNLGKSLPVSMRSQNVLAQALGKGFAGMNQMALTKQALKKSP